MTDPVPTLDEVINDPGRQEEWGNQLGKKHQEHIRICFQNVRGLIPKMTVISNSQY